MEGKQRWVLSWPFLAWPHSVGGHSIPPAESIASHLFTNVLQDNILRATALVLGLDSTSKIVRKLHKAGLSGDLWWKACDSNRQDSLLVAPDGRKIASCYVGGCPRVPRCFEVVVIAHDVSAAAVLALLPQFLADWGLPQKRTFRQPQVRCGLWDDEPPKRDAAVTTVNTTLSQVQMAMLDRKRELEVALNQRNF